MLLISVFDKKSSTYAPPLTFDHISAALRSYIAFARQKPDAMQVQFSEDYDLYEVGQFEAVSGQVTPTIPPQYVESLIHVVAQARKEVSNG